MPCRQTSLLRVRVHMQFLSALGEEKASGAAAENHEDMTGGMTLIGDHRVGQESPLARSGQDGADFRQQEDLARNGGFSLLTNAVSSAVVICRTPGV